MDLKRFGEKLQKLRKEAGLSQERLGTALDELAQTGPIADQRAIDSTLISRWEQARELKGRQWKPTRPYVFYLIRLFQGYLDRTSAQEWTIQAGYRLTPQELQDLFPVANAHLPDESEPAPPATTSLIEDNALIVPPLTNSILHAKLNTPEDSPLLPIMDLSDMPVTAHFHGRTVEVRALEEWLQQKPTRAKIRLVAVLGMGGMGKTALAAHVVTHLTTMFANEFRFVLWRSVLNAPPLTEVLRHWLTLLSHQTQLTLPATLAEQIGLLLHYLRKERCLLVLDNLESLLQVGEQSGQMRPGYEGYEELLQAIGASEHNSCLLLTSREQPEILDRVVRNTATTRVLSVTGLDLQAGKALLQAQGLTLLPQQATSLIQHYSGNPLALQIVANTITDWFAGDLEAFQREGTPVFHDIRAVLDQQVARLSELEQELLVWFAIEREAVTAPVLRENLVQKWPARSFLEALHALTRRALLVKQGDGFTLQNVIIEYTTDRLIEAICTELRAGSAVDFSSSPTLPQVEEGWAGGSTKHARTPSSPFTRAWLNRFALLKAQAKEYVRQSQERLIVQPIIERMLAEVGYSVFIEQLKQLLTKLRTTTEPEGQVMPGYAGGNLLNLLLVLNMDLTHANFSRLALWQAYLQGVDLPQVNLAGADLRGAVFTKNFGLCRVLTFAPDGQVLGGGMTNGEIHLWQLDDGQPLAMIKVHETRIWDIAFSPDGQQLVSGSKDQTVRLTERNTGVCLRIFTGHTDWVRTVAFHPQGQLVASGSQDQTVRLWDIASGQQLHLLPHAGWVLDLAFSPDGAYLVSAGTDHILYLWEVATGAKVATWHEHRAAIYTVTFSPDGALLATGSDDRTVRVWEVAAMTQRDPTACRAVLTGHQAGIYVTAFSPNRQWLFSGGAEAAIRVWDVTTGQLLHTLPGHQREVNSMSISPAGQVLATGEADTSMVYLWDLIPQPRVRAARLGYRHWTNAIAFHPQLPLLAGASADGKVALWQAATGHYLKTLRGVKSISRALAFGANSQRAETYLAVGSTDGTVRVWIVSTQTMPVAGQQIATPAVGQPVRVLQAPGEIHAIAFNQQQNELFAGSYAGTVQHWDLTTGQPLHTFHLPGDPRIKSIAVSPDGQFLAAGSHNATVALWEIATGALRELQGHTAWIWTVAFHPSSRFLASGCFDRTVRLWHLPTGDLYEILPHLTSLIQVIAFSPDGNRLAVGMGDATIYLWATDGLSQMPVTAPTLIAKLQGHADLIQGLAFSHDSTLLASASLDGTIKIWAMTTNTSLYTLRAPGPYTGMNITGVTGITAAQQEALKALGAITT